VFWGSWDSDFSHLPEVVCVGPCGVEVVDVGMVWYDAKVRGIMDALSIWFEVI
jgi:hypothetical protein